MPTYEYRCAKCGDHLEVFQSFSEKPLTKHQDCGGKLAKVLSPAGIVLKGSGFYKNDSRDSSKSKSRSSSSAGETSSSSESKSDSKSDAKSDSKSDSNGGSKSDSKPSGGDTKTTPATKSA